MKAHRFGITVVAVASVATAIGAGAAITGNTPPWLEALNERSEALNRETASATTRSAGSSDPRPELAPGAPGPERGDEPLLRPR